MSKGFNKFSYPRYFREANKIQEYKEQLRRLTGSPEIDMVKNLRSVIEEQILNLKESSFLATRTVREYDESLRYLIDSSTINLIGNLQPRDF